MEAHNHGQTVERAKHHYNAAILSKVGGSLRPAAGLVLIDNLKRSQNAEGVPTLRRHVDMPLRRKRRRGDKENALAGNPVREIRVNIFALLAHGA